MTIDIATLSPEERLKLLEQLWGSLSSSPSAVPLTKPQRDELDRRLDELDREGPVGIPWEEVYRRISSRRACTKQQPFAQLAVMDLGVDDR